MAIDRGSSGLGRTLDVSPMSWWTWLGEQLASPRGVLATAAVAFLAGLSLSWSGVLPGTPAAELSDELARQGVTLEQTRGELAVQHIQNQRLREIHGYSAEYGVPADLAATVYDIALSEGVEPFLAFRLVEAESSFRRMAVSEAGAVGYTQIKPSTALWLDPSVTPDRLFDARTNLRLGFRYFALLLDQYGGDEKMALLAYNRGPGRVQSLLATGRDPANGYARRILTGGR